MNVKAILAAKKQGGDTIGIEPTAKLAAAAKLLVANHIGALVIRGAGGRLSGILSERDIVRALSEQGTAALDLPVGQIMTRDVETCGEDDSVASIMERMTAGKFRHMPVLDNHLLVGLVSIGDIGKQQTEILRDHLRQLTEDIDQQV